MHNFSISELEKRVQLCYDCKTHMVRVCVSFASNKIEYWDDNFDAFRRIVYSEYYNSVRICAFGYTYRGALYYYFNKAILNLMH